MKATVKSPLDLAIDAMEKERRRALEMVEYYQRMAAEQAEKAETCTVVVAQLQRLRRLPPQADPL